VTVDLNAGKYNYHNPRNALGGHYLMSDNKWLRNGFVWIVLIIAVVALWFTFMGGGGGSESLNFADVAAKIKAGQVERLDTKENSNEITVHFVGNDQTATTRLPPGNLNIWDALEHFGIPADQVQIKANPGSSWAIGSVLSHS
jgi:cell division protease FtsH